MRTRSWLVGLILLACVGCATAPASPPTVDVTGTWRGPWLSGVGSGDWELTLLQNGATVTGDLKMSGTQAVNRNGRVEGTVNGDVLNIIQPAVSLRAELKVSGDEMRGRASDVIAYQVSLHRQR